ncbi:hypothetical protein BGZ74_004214 [Mortierella antarctica]|nr:hypothetical protein BGZ74_004214 [Mortierella antarctica]
MRTRQTKGMMDSSEATPHTPPSHDLEMELDTNMASPTEEKAVSTINHPDIATTQSQPKDSRKAKKRPTTKDSSTKRTRTKPYDLPKLSYSASLPKIVWVFDRQYQWWPGEISPYPSQGNRAKVTRSLQVDCTESNIRPFLHPSKTEYYTHGSESRYADIFERAYCQASDAQMKDDDGLPDDIFSLIEKAVPMPTHNLVPTISPKEAQAPGAQIVPTRKKNTSIPSTKTTPSSSGYFPDKSLSIPGELVLARAQSERVYYPGKVLSFNEKSNKYKLGALEQPKLDPNYENEELQFLLSKIYPGLYAILAGAQDEGGRLANFLKGGKARRDLSSRVSPGQFNRQEYMYINNMLQAEFLPDLITTKRLGLKSKRAQPPGEHVPMKKKGDVTEGFNDQLRLHFVLEVLLPETITRLTMDMNKCTYKEADEQVERVENNSQHWVDEVLAARESFLEGRAS